jgi:hypothetical protein
MAHGRLWRSAISSPIAIGEKKGPVTQAARDFFYASRCLLPPGKFNDLLSIPSIFPEAMNAQLRRIDSRIIQRDTGLREK